MALRQQEERTVNLRGQEVSALRDVDDVLVNHTQQQATAQHSNGSKSQRAAEVAHRTAEDMNKLCEGVNNRIEELGLVVANAQTYHGVREHIFGGLGKMGIGWARNRAAILRHDRIQTLSFDGAIAELKTYVLSVIEQLGESEQDYRTDLLQYKNAIDVVLTKLNQANPKLLDAQARRQKLEAEVDSLNEELSAGTLSQLERPVKQKELEDKDREFERVRLEEKTLAAIVKEAQEALPTLKQNRQAASASIESLHSMRQSELEKFNNLRVVLDRAVTAMKARSKAELYKTVDPAFNKGVEAVTMNNVATCGAIIETWADRIKHAAIDPETSQALLNELVENITDAAAALKENEDKLKVGNNLTPTPLPNGHDIGGDLN